MKKLIALCILLVMAGCSTPGCEYRYKKIVKVGGCNRGGDCAVLFEDGTDRVVNLPVEGATLKVEICH